MQTENEGMEKDIPWKWKSKESWSACMYAHSCPIYCDLWTITCQAHLSLEFSRQEYWSGLSFPSPGVLPNSGIEPAFLVSPALAGRFFTIAPPAILISDKRGVGWGRRWEGGSKGRGYM